MLREPKPTKAISKVIDFKRTSKKPSIEQLIGFVGRKKREQGRYRTNRNKASN